MQQPMKANPKDLFEGRKHFEIPPFQRPYVWNEEDQWAPLWDDVIRVSESHLVDGVEPVRAHFLGAIVFQLNQATSAGLTTHEVIDGQQRLTTLQVLLNAARRVLEDRGHGVHAQLLGELTRNAQAEFAKVEGRFKLWPSQADREAFSRVMDGSDTQGFDGHPLVMADRFFGGEAHRWLEGRPSEDGAIPPSEETSRARQLSETLASRLMLVAIDLSNDDDAQLVFETLNDRGTPLLKADLIKNWVFQTGKKLGADVDGWSQKIWDDFDTEWWRAEIAQGRVNRSRVDIFLQYWLTMRTLDEVKSELVFRLFTQYAAGRMTSVALAEDFLRELRSDADTYRGIASLDRSTPAGRFRAQVIEAMELAATMPVFLWFISKNHAVPDGEIAIGLGALESWVTRRTLLKLTSKDVNRFMVAVLKDLQETDVQQAGSRLREFLLEQTADSRYWPNDAEMLAELPGKKLYGSMKQSRLTAVLGAVEAQLRASSSKHEDVAMPAGLSLEHIMPRGWRTFWDEDPPLTREMAAKRDVLIHTIGNLTLTTSSLNSALSHRPWTDSDAQGLKEGGQAGKGKRSLLSAYSLLVLNKEVIDKHEDEWTETDIADRSRALAELIITVWPRPEIRKKEGASPAKGDAND